ncbi:MAG: type I-U CRISPR-associated helicase/endonuclease Cas3 [Fimbriiglobus sp.]|nr:type I-U CRISPR-associated helicase/endonuclease Cas3 [Fimbriiglobus sp.]
MSDFGKAFEELTDHPPFPWQQALYQRFMAGDIPASCNLPTGLGKTSVIAVWLIALANGAKVPRRLVYVVNRRTVVDQTTDEVEKYRFRLGGAGPVCQEGLRELARRLAALSSNSSGWPLAVSTLRGQFADNREWSADPSRPAVICGTVDMIGSRLLFSGYGIGPYDRVHQVGLLGCDTLLVHDEAHLTDPFQKLLRGIQREQQAETATGCGLRVMELTATSRTQEANTAALFTLSPEDEQHSVVSERLNAGKTLRIHQRDNPIREIVKLAAAHKESGRPILVFVQTPDQVNEVVNGLSAKEHKIDATTQVRSLTGTMRGYDRDRLATVDGVFARFLPNPKTAPKPGTVYLVCTSAGEVGVDISADHLVCDLSTYESMAQRFGRVNRRGGTEHESRELRHAFIDVVHEPVIDTDTPRGERRESTRVLLQKLVDEHAGSASPNSLRKNLSEAEKQAAFAPCVPSLEATDILFDAWSLTTITDDLPGRPPVANWLHGLEAPDQPTTAVAWRNDVIQLALDTKASAEEVAERAREIEAYLKEYPLRSHEQLAEKTARLVSVPNIDAAETGRRQHLKELAKRSADLPTWLIDIRNRVTLTTVGQLAEMAFGELMGRTIVLPPAVGGLSAAGMLDGREPHEPNREYDVADWSPGGGPNTRTRVTLAAANEEPDDGFEKVAEIVLSENADGEPARRFIARVMPEELAGDNSRSRQGRFYQTLCDHLGWAGHYARLYAECLPPGAPERQAVIVAAKHHDRGKDRDRWQNGVGNPKRGAKDWQPIAKSGRSGRILGLDDYRHEFGSLLDVQSHPDFMKLSDDQKELVLHLIAAHHGRARPHFPPDEAFDPERPHAEAEKMASEVPQRFARLQRKYGRWGLAYLESLLRAADWAASANPSKFVEGDQ